MSSKKGNMNKKPLKKSYSLNGLSGTLDGTLETKVKDLIEEPLDAQNTLSDDYTNKSRRKYLKNIRQFKKSQNKTDTEKSGETNDSDYSDYSDNSDDIDDLDDLDDVDDLNDPGNSKFSDCSDCLEDMDNYDNSDDNSNDELDLNETTNKSTNKILDKLNIKTTNFTKLNKSTKFNNPKITKTIPNKSNGKTTKKSTKNSNEIFKELIKKQLPDVPAQWKLNINDMKRICKYIDTSIFDKDHCCIWNGYITNINNSNKGTYVNFYFRNKKVALHRLLYSNFVAPLNSSEYLKFNCDNKGICCNINHYEKYKYSKNNVVVKKEPKNKEHKKEVKEVIIIGSDDPDKLIINFD
ncbi:hypothetical protein qu_348 [Acanthamoeba polyphaga mimivirus]|nr:hypothetical protein [Mimivirus reunion]WMV61683.1 hypothetical protein qu_348 [Mimivirus sp.]WMV62660.1 hypothetical protein qu_348 [Acanthamoeba polyphaga mimivirus]WMV63637.1 hypothetical protein qu_348 [Mimivirus sp.]